jgi:sulfonate transport system permease protein
VTTNALTDARILVRAPRHAPESVAARRRVTRAIQMVSGFVLPILLVALWQTASVRGWIDRRVYPAPSDVASSMRELWRSGRLWDDTWSSLNLILRGFLLGSAIGFAVGVMTGLSRYARSALEPLLNALYVVPKLALLPVFLTIFGFADAPKIALITVTVFFFVWIETMEALGAVQAGYVEAARAFGVNRLQLFWHVHLPAILPQLFVALRISMGVAVLVTIAAEFVVGGTGLGYLIFSSNQLFLLGRVYAGVITVAIVGVVLSGAVSLLGRRLTPWERRRHH